MVIERCRKKVNDRPAGLGPASVGPQNVRRTVPTFCRQGRRVAPDNAIYDRFRSDDPFSHLGAGGEVILRRNPQAAAARDAAVAFFETNLQTSAERQFMIVVHHLNDSRSRRVLWLSRVWVSYAFAT